MAETLTIVVEIGQAEANLLKVGTAIKSVGDATAALQSKAGNALNKIIESINKVKPIDPNVVSGLTALGTAMSGLQTGLGSINGLANELNKLARVDVDKVAQNVQALSVALKDIQVPPGIGQMATALGNLASAANQTTTAVRAVSRSIDPTTAAFNALNREALNSLGWMGNFGPTLGRILQPLQTLAAEGLSISGVIQGMAAQFGNLGKLVTTLGPGVGAIIALGAATVALGPSIIEATTKYQQFVLAVDAVKGSGAGVKEFERVKEIAARTGASVDSLSGAYSKFSIAATASGLSADKTAQIFEGFSTGLRGVGASAQQTEKAFLAIQQMMSKSTVGAEELRQQLGDAMPNAMQVFAKAAGVSEKALMKMMEAGQVVAADILPKVGKLLQEQFGPTLAQSLQQSAAQINVFGNAMQELLRSMGGGVLGGLAAGFAAGLTKINEALQSPGLQIFARVLGDLMGLLSGGLMAALGGFVTGMMAVFNVIGMVLKAIVDLLSPITEWFNKLTGGATIIGTITTAVGILATVLGALSAVWLVLAVRTAAYTIATSAAATVTWLMNTALYASVAANVAAAAAFLLTPWGILTAGIGLFALAIYSVVKAMQSTGAATTDLNEKLTANSTTTQVATQALREWANEMGKSPNDIMAAGNAILSFAKVQSDAKTAVQELKQQQQELGHTMKQSSLDNKEAERGSAMYVNSLKQGKQALTENRQSIQHHSEDLKTNAKTHKEAAAASDHYTTKLKTQTGAHKQVSAAHKESTQSVDVYAGALTRAKRSQEDASNAITRETQLLAEEKAAHAQSADAMARSSDRMKELEQRYTTYKAVLNDAQLAQVKNLESMGLARDKAVEVVTVTDQLTRSIGSQVAELEKQGNKELQAAQTLGTYIGRLQEARAAEAARLAANGETDSAMKVRLQIWDDQIAKEQALQKEQIKAAATNLAMAESMKQGIPVQIAMAQVVGEVAKKFGIDLPTAQKLADDAFKDMNKSTLSSAELWAKWKEAFLIAWNVVLRVLELARPIFNFFVSAIEMIVTAAEKLRGSNEGAAKTAQAVADGYSKAGNAAAGAATNTDRYGKSVLYGTQASQQGVQQSQQLGQALGGVGQSAGSASQGLQSYNNALATTAQAAGNVVPNLTAAKTAQTGYDDEAKKGVATAEQKIIKLQEEQNAIQASLGIKMQALDAERNNVEVTGMAIGKMKDYIGFDRQRRNGQVVTIEVLAGHTAKTLENIAALEAQIAAETASLATKQAAAQALEREINLQNASIGAMGARVSAVTGEKDALDLAHQANRARIAEFENERIKLGQTNNALIERAKALQETRDVEAGAANSVRGLVEALNQEIDKTNESIAANQQRQIMMDKNIESLNAQMAAERQAATTSKDNLSGAYQEWAKMGEAMKKASDESVRWGGTVVETKGIFGDLIQKVTGGNQVFDVMSDKLGKLGTVTRDAKGAIVDYTAGLEDLFSKEQTAAIAKEQMAEATRKAAEAEVAFMQSSLAALPSVQTLGDTVTKAGESFKAMGEAEGLITLKASDFQGSVNLMNQSMQLFRNELSQPIESGLPQDMDKLNESLAGFRDGMITTADVNAKFQQSLLKVDSGTDALASSVNDAGNKFGTYDETSDNARQSTDDTTQSMQSAANSASSLASSVNSAASSYRNLAAAQAAAKDSGGGGGGNEQQQREGGFVGQAIGRKQKTELGDFDNAPHLAAGTQNTSRFSSKLSGGGIPTVLHPNEAVIPLSKGRKIPVDLSVKGQNSQVAADPGLPTEVKIVPHKVDLLTDAVKDGTAEIAKAVTDSQKSMEKTMYKLPSGGGEGSSGVKGQANAGGDGGMLGPPPQSASSGIGSSGGGVTAANAGGDGGFQPTAAPQPAPIVVNINMPVHTTDADTFKRSQDQIAKAQAEKTKRALSRIG